MPVVALSQLNRGPEQRTDKKPQLSDLRESGAIEQDADVVILLHREDMYEPESPRAGEADFIVAKHRNGPTRDRHRGVPGPLQPLRRHGSFVSPKRTSDSGWPLSWPSLRFRSARRTTRCLDHGQALLGCSALLAAR